MSGAQSGTGSATYTVGDLARRKGGHTMNDAPAEEASSSATRPVRVLISLPLEPEHSLRISQVDPRVEVLKLYEQGDSANPDAEQWKQIEEAEADAALLQAEVLFAFRFPLEWLQKAPRLKWVQLASAGADHMIAEGIFARRPNLLLTTASGIHEVHISEHIVAMILFFSRKFNVAVRRQALRRWERYQGGEALGKTVCMLGYGPIARRAAALCKALGMRVVAVRGSIAEQQPGFEAVERFYPDSDLNAVLAESDYVVIAAPLTPKTRGIVGKEQLAAMKKSAVLVNISRGAIVDEAAMIAALREGEIGGAALDVFAQEPLPEGSPLWDMPNVLITPHVSGSNPQYNERATALFCDNLTRYLRGEPPRNLVDRERGY
ncbi:MAG: D-2-hydroxyacid dehydrogenase [Actinomycetota bacterium]|nr:D-2-hydroxyacid dehydrogenase [Actinomycetota bacterium]